MKISVVVPVYRSEKILPILHDRLKKVLIEDYPDHEILLVDDCSPDGSWGGIESLSQSDPSVKGIQLMKNSGQGSATLAGISEASGDYIVTLDDDLQHPPEEIPKLVAALIEDPSLDVAIGAPIEKRHHLIRRVGSSAINRINSIVLNKDPNLRFTGFRAMTDRVGRELVRVVAPYPALGPMILSVTRRIRNIPVEHHAREIGRSNYSFGRLMKQTLSNLVGYSMLPLRILAVLGFIGIVLSAAIGFFFVARYAIRGIGVPGWMSLLLILVSLSGFNFFAFALLGEYILRIFQMSSVIPNYTIRKIVQRGGDSHEGTKALSEDS